MSSSSSSSSSSSLVGSKRARSPSDDYDEGHGLDIIDALGRLDFTEQKFKEDFEALFEQFKTREFDRFDSENFLQNDDIKQITKEFGYGFLPFDSDFSRRLHEIIHENEYFMDSFESFIESSLARYLAPNILPDFMGYIVGQWELTTDPDIDIDNSYLDEYIRFISKLVISLCSESSDALDYYLSRKKRERDTIFAYFQKLRLINVFEFTYIQIRLDQCNGNDKLLDFFSNNNSSIETGTIRLEDGLFDFDRMEMDDFFEPFIRSFITDKNWDACMEFFSQKFDYNHLRFNRYLPKSLNAFTFGFKLKLDDPMIAERIRNSHGSDLPAGYFKVLEQIYEFFPYFIIYLLKTNLYQLYNPKIINHLLQKYINLITLSIQDISAVDWPIENDNWLDVDREQILDIISKIENYKRITGFDFHITYIPCSSLQLSDDNKQIDLLFLWFKSITIKEADLAKYREKCPKIFDTERWNTLDTEERVPVPVTAEIIPFPIDRRIIVSYDDSHLGSSIPIGPRVRRPSVEFPRGEQSLTDRIFYYCFF